jgi:hypothetical protein
MVKRKKPVVPGKEVVCSWIHGKRKSVQWPRQVAQKLVGLSRDSLGDDATPEIIGVLKTCTASRQVFGDVFAEYPFVRSEALSE